MTQHELDTIDERADKEIFELLCCEMTKRRIAGRKASARLLKRYEAARMRFESHLPEGTEYLVECTVESDGNGRPRRGGQISCSIITVDEETYRMMRQRAEDDDDDDEF